MKGEVDAHINLVQLFHVSRPARDEGMRHTQEDANEGREGLGKQGDCSCALYGNERMNGSANRMREWSEHTAEGGTGGSSLLLRCTAPPPPPRRGN